MKAPSRRGRLTVMRDGLRDQPVSLLTVGSCIASWRVPGVYCSARTACDSLRRVFQEAMAPAGKAVFVPASGARGPHFGPMNLLERRTAGTLTVYDH